MFYTKGYKDIHFFAYVGASKKAPKTISCNTAPTAAIIPPLKTAA